MQIKFAYPVMVSVGKLNAAGDIVILVRYGRYSKIFHHISDPDLYKYNTVEKILLVSPCQNSDD